MLMFLNYNLMKYYRVILCSLLVLLGMLVLRNKAHFPTLAQGKTESFDRSTYRPVLCYKFFLVLNNISLPCNATIL
jgi:hypothetical protein